jgi:hypothetical protein
VHPITTGLILAAIDGVGDPNRRDVLALESKLTRVLEDKDRSFRRRKAVSASKWPAKISASLTRSFEKNR